MVSRGGEGLRAFDSLTEVHTLCSLAKREDRAIEAVRKVRPRLAWSLDNLSCKPLVLSLFKAVRVSSLDRHRCVLEIIGNATDGSLANSEPLGYTAVLPVWPSKTKNSALLRRGDWTVVHCICA